MNNLLLNKEQRERNFLFVERMDHLPWTPFIKGVTAASINGIMLSPHSICFWNATGELLFSSMYCLFVHQGLGILIPHFFHRIFLIGSQLKDVQNHVSWAKPISLVFSCQTRSLFGKQHKNFFRCSRWANPKEIRSLKLIFMCHVWCCWERPSSWYHQRS